VCFLPTLLGFVVTASEAFDWMTGFCLSEWRHYRESNPLEACRIASLKVSFDTVNKGE
jgi:hypothetical protein